MEKYDYASILFSRKCNSKCYFCIGNSDKFKNFGGNLNSKNLAGLEDFILLSKSNGIKYLSISGINADPQQYLYEMDFINILKNELPNSELSLHTNGRNALSKNKEFNSYDKCTLSFASFDKKSYKKLMGVDSIDINSVINNSMIPIKLSMILTEHNFGQEKDYILHAAELGIKRVIIRKLFGKENEFSLLEYETPKRFIYKNPVYEIDGVEVTVWNYSDSSAKAIYLFPDGSIRHSFI